jgi:hypothetical protein
MSRSLFATGLLFLLYPAVRPWHDESTVEGARAAMGSGAWVASHLFAMLGFILVPLGLVALHRAVAGRLTAAAAVLAWLGAGLTLPYYGAEDFGLHAMAAEPNLLDLAEAVRFNPVAATMFIAGLLALGVGAVLAGIAVWRSTVLPRYSGVVFAVGFALFIPQFYLPAGARIGHGVLVAIGCVWLAVALLRGERTTQRPVQQGGVAEPVA